MSKCKYCGHKAGPFSDKHKECEEKYLNGKTSIISLIKNTIVEATDFNNLKSEIEQIATDSYVKTPEIEKLYIKGFDKAVDIMLEDGIITKEEEERVDKFTEQFDLPSSDIHNSVTRVVQSCVIQELSEGIISEDRFNFEGLIPVNFQKAEKLIWMFVAVDFYEQRIKTHYEGGYTGVSFRVAKGVSVRTGGFKGHPVKTEEMKHIAVGDFIITSKNIYFSSSTKSLRIPLGKIIRMEPYSDGIQLQKDGVTAKPQIFSNLDGLFVYDVISNLNKI